MYMQNVLGGSAWKPMVFIKISIHSFTVWVFAQTMTASVALGQTPTPTPTPMLMHGPVVGGVTAQTANVFVRTDQAASVALRYGTDPNLGTYLTSDTFQTSSASDFTKVIPLGNLAGERTYYMNVVVNDVLQFASPPYPSFTTFARSGTSRTFNFVVLTDFVPTYELTVDVPTFASAAATNPAFVFIGGDFDHRNPQTLDEKRQMFKDLYNANTPHMGDFVNLILRKTPIIHQWDDHDAGQNNIDRYYPDWNLNQQVFQEYVPSYPLPSVTPAGIWQKFSYAQADFFVLDCRSQRDPVTDPPQERSMLDGRDFGPSGELQWLKNGLRTSTARWKIIFTSVITNTTAKENDAWGAYQTEWNSLKTFINNNNIQGVVFISGDLHLGAIDNGAHNGGFPEMCVAEPNSIQDPPACASASTGTWSEGFYTGTCTGFGLVNVSQDQLILQVADETGAIKISYTVSHP
jgi:alkaline phosphatase D